MTPQDSKKHYIIAHMEKKSHMFTNQTLEND